MEVQRKFGEVQKLIPAFQIDSSSQNPIAVIKAGEEFHLAESKIDAELKAGQIVDVNTLPHLPIG